MLHVPSAGGALEVRSLSVTYHQADRSIPVVRDVSFTLRPGESLGLVGESGSGKSTVAAAILGLLPDNAEVKAEKLANGGVNLLTMPPKARRKLLGSTIGVVFQDPFSSLNPALTAGYQIAEPLTEHRCLSWPLAIARARSLLEEFGIADSDRVSNAYPHQLSGGMRQRAMIAAAIACEPSLLVLDEPTTALDVTIQKQILDLLADLRRTRALSYLFVSHDLAVVRDVCDKVCVLYGGEVVEQGLSSDVLDKPRHPYTKGLLAAAPRLELNQGTTRSAGIPGKKPDPAHLPDACIFHPRCPFAEERCRQDSQVLLPVADFRQVRCWKNSSISDRPWPLAGVEVTARPRQTSQPLIGLKNARKDFRQTRGFRFPSLSGRNASGPQLAAKPAVDGVTFSIGKGEVLGLVGESGSGKSTVGRLLARLIKPTDGVIEFDGSEIAAGAREPADFRRRVQIILQNPDSSLNPRHTIRQIIGRPLKFFGLVQSGKIDARVRELLGLVQLDPAYLDRYPFELSGGERQRVGIARALASEPEFIICDEAVSALDVAVQATIVNLLKDLQQRLGLSYLFISHDLALVSQIADRIAVMQNGRIREIGLSGEVLRPPFHPYTATLLNSLPRRETSAMRTSGPETLAKLPAERDGVLELSPTHRIYA